jgi:tRNA (cmo5U34)-methyltransferase
MSMTQLDPRHFLDAFDDPSAVAQYSGGPRRFVPGFDALHRMTGILLAERVPDDASVLVLGAGGGLELEALARAYPGWRFTGVDPAAEMLRLAAHNTRDFADRIELVEGLIDAAPPDPFDGATCLLTLHFLNIEERIRTLQAMRSRLKSGAPLIVAHSSFAQTEPERTIWLQRYAAFAQASGADPQKVREARQAVAGSLSLLSPEQERDVLFSAGFVDVDLFFAAFTWRGWVAYAGS